MNIYPSPMLWLSELESVNSSMEAPPLNVRFSMLAMKRGVDVDALNWPGEVFLPSGIISKNIGAGIINVPGRWTEALGKDVSKFVAILNGWSQEKLIFQVDGLASEIAMGAPVYTELNPNILYFMPTYSIYVDTGNQKRSHSKDIPDGFFISKDIDSSGNVLLNIAIDWVGEIELVSIPLNGSTLDDYIILNKSKINKSNNTVNLRNSSLSCNEDLLHLILSFSLMVTSGISHHEYVEGEPYENWRHINVKKCFHRGINDLYNQLTLGKSKKDYLITSSWSMDEFKKPFLVCSISAGLKAY